MMEKHDKATKRFQFDLELDMFKYYTVDTYLGYSKIAKFKITNDKEKRLIWRTLLQLNFKDYTNSWMGISAPCYIQVNYTGKKFWFIKYADSINTNDFPDYIK